MALFLTCIAQIGIDGIACYKSTGPYKVIKGHSRIPYWVFKGKDWALCLLVWPIDSGSQDPRILEANIQKPSISFS